MNNRIYGSLPQYDEFYEKFRGQDIQEWLDLFLNTITKNKNTQIKTYKKFIDKKLSAANTESPVRRRQILAAISMARARLAMCQSDSDSEIIETELAQAVIEGRESRDPIAALISLGLTANQFRDDSLERERTLLLMQSTAYSGNLYGSYLGVIFEKIDTTWFELSDYLPITMQMYVWRSTFSSIPLQLLIERAAWISRNMGNDPLVEEAEPVIRSCWHIGRAVAALDALSRGQDASIQCQLGLRLATEQEDTIWIREFDDYIAGNAVR